MTGLAWGIGFECIVCAVVLQQYWSYPLWVYKHVLVLGLLFEIFCIPSYLALYYPKWFDLQAINGERLIHSLLLFQHMGLAIAARLSSVRFGAWLPFIKFICVLCPRPHPCSLLALGWLVGRSVSVYIKDLAFRLGMAWNNWLLPLQQNKPTTTTTTAKPNSGDGERKRWLTTAMDTII